MLFAALVNPTLIPIPYRIYQPKRAGNLPIPANPPVNKWDATLILIMNDDDDDDELPLPEVNSKLVNS